MVYYAQLFCLWTSRAVYRRPVLAQQHTPVFGGNIEVREMHMNCDKCGKKLRKNQPFCPGCGAPRPAEPPATVSLRAAGGKKKLTKKQLAIRIAIIVAAVLAALAIAVVSVVTAFLNRVNRTSEISGSTGINSEIEFSKDVTNIALFGLDTRQNNDVGRSDAMIIVSIDRAHDKIKMTSLARDSYVKVDGHGRTKLTHAWAYGKASLAVKTINQNYGMNITDYAYVNFYEFVDLIDYIGGVDIELNAAELKIANEYYAPELNSLGIKCPPIPGTGLQHLTGAQALAHSRNRYTGSDIDRGNRQKQVLQAAYEQMKKTPVTKYPGVIGKILDMVHTNLTNGEMLSIATWALSNNPTIEMLSLPTPACKPSGGNWGDGSGWVYRYDLDIATAVLHDFIYETNTDLSTISTTAIPQKPAGTTTTTTTQSATTTKPDSSTTKPDVSTKPDGSTTKPDTSTKPDGSTTKPDESTTKPEGTTTTTTKPEGTTTTTTKPTEKPGDTPAE